MITQDMLAFGELMEYDIIDPCCITDCRMRANNYVVIADDYYELCAFHYAEYLLLYSHNKREAQEAIDNANELINQQVLSRVYDNSSFGVPA